MIQVTLSDEEQALCKEVAMSRYSTSRALGLTQLRIDTSNMDVELLGVQGELAFAKTFNLEDPKDNLGSDGGADYIIQGVTIDVKTAAKPYYRLIFRSLDAFKATIAVLVVQVNDNTFNLIGWATKKQFLAQCAPFKDGNFILEQKQLKPIEELLERVK